MSAVSWTSSPASSQSLLVRTVDLGLIFALVGVPLALGGRQPLGQLLLYAIACGTAIAWFLHRLWSGAGRWKFTGAEPLLLAGASVAILQFMHLPEAVVHLISPRLAHILPLWFGQSAASPGLGPWTQLSLTPVETQRALATFLAYGLLFLVTAQRIERLEDGERLLRCLALAAAGMALFGLVQFLVGNGKFFWVYEHPFTTTDDAPKGSFPNRNHFAHFLALGAGPLTWWVWRWVSGSRRLPATFGRSPPRSGSAELALALIGGALGLVAFAVLLSLSRGGTVALCTAVLTCLFILQRRNLVSRRLLAGLAGVSALLCALLFTYGSAAVSARLDDWELPQRLAIWKANVHIFRDFPLVGTGLGSHAQVYPLYLNLPGFRKEFTHAENGYLQVASEMGLAGLVLVLGGCGLCAAWCVRGIRQSTDHAATAALAAVSASLAASAVHSAGDFIWYMPGCMVPVPILAALACRLFQMAREPGNGRHASRLPAGAAVAARRRPVEMIPLAGLVCVAVWMLRMQAPALAAEPSWQRYLLLAVNSEHREETPDAQGNLEVLKQKMTALAQAAKANRTDARIQLRAAQGYLSLFHLLQRESPNRMSLMQVREAAVKANFAGPQELQQWLNRALGDNARLLYAARAHARQALRLCPLQGQAYLYLAQLEFLGAAETAVAVAPLVEQAELVRPHDPQVLFAVGREAWAVQDFPKAVARWKAAFRQDERTQREIVQILAPHVPAAGFIREFEPKTAALELLTETYRSLGRSEDLRLAAGAFAKSLAHDAAILEDRDAVKKWLSAAAAYDQLADAAQAERCLQEAYFRDPNWFRVRYAYGTWLFRQQRFAEAAEHLVWCSKQNAEDKQLRRLAEAALEHQLRLVGPGAPRTH